MSGMMNATDQTDRPQDYSKKMFIGRVEVSDDPKQCHRIKVSIPDLLEYDSEFLPWAIPGSVVGGSGPNETFQWIPEVGSFVQVTLQDGDVNFPVYWGGAQTHETNRGVLATNYPHRVGFRINSYTERSVGDERKRKFQAKDNPSPYPEKGHHFFIDRSTNDLEYLHPEGTKVHVWANGKVTLDVLNSGNAPDADLIIDVIKGLMDVHIKKTLNIHAESDITITSDTHIQLTAPRIDLN